MLPRVSRLRTDCMTEGRPTRRVGRPAVADSAGSGDLRRPTALSGAYWRRSQARRSSTLSGESSSKWSYTNPSSCNCPAGGQSSRLFVLDDPDVGEPHVERHPLRIDHVAEDPHAVDLAREKLTRPSIVRLVEIHVSADAAIAGVERVAAGVEQLGAVQVPRHVDRGELERHQAIDAKRPAFDRVR